MAAAFALTSMLKTEKNNDIIEAWREKDVDLFADYLMHLTNLDVKCFLENTHFVVATREQEAEVLQRILETQFTIKPFQTNLSTPKSTNGNASAAGPTRMATNEVKSSYRVNLFRPLPEKEGFKGRKAARELVRDAVDSSNMELFGKVLPQDRGHVLYIECFSAELAL